MDQLNAMNEKTRIRQQIYTSNEPNKTKFSLLFILIVLYFEWEEKKMELRLEALRLDEYNDWEKKCNCNSFNFLRWSPLVANIIQ